jgi:anaerobic selenocysteine-containing dehydrogenase
MEQGMSENISRRNFIKLAGLGIGSTAILTGCGPASRYVKRQPYSEMPEYAVNGKSTYYATTCGECSAGCGLVVRTTEGRAHKVEGNPAHPVNKDGSCSRGQATLQGLYNPDRLKGPSKQATRGSGQYSPIKWEEAFSIIKEAWQTNSPGEIAFLLGLFPDHLYDLVQTISTSLGGAKVLRYGTLGEMEGRVTLLHTTEKLLGVKQLPAFDIENADLIFSFGANFLETWLSPVAFSFNYGNMRQGRPGRRGYLVQFEPYMSQTAANADEWFPIHPGSEMLLAQGLGRLVAELKSGTPPPAFAQVNIAETVDKTGVSEANLRRLARVFSESPNPLAIPGGVPCGNRNGQAAAESILGLNLLVNNLGKPGGIYVLPPDPLSPNFMGWPNSIVDVDGLIGQMNAGQIKTLFIHGINPVYDLPKAYGFQAALQKVSLVISFASFPDETALQADYVLPDNTPLESWGYQKIRVGSDRLTISGLQPVVVPLYDTRATADVLLASVQAVGGKLAQDIPFTDEVDFLEKSVFILNDQGGFYTAPTPESFFALWQQYGGWWQANAGWVAPAAGSSALAQPLGAAEAQFSGNADEYPLLLLPFPHPNLADGSQANRPTLQETPDPMTSAMWNSWVAINPETATKLGVHNDDLVTVASSSGSVEAVVYEYPALEPGVIAIPLGQGHTAFGRYAQGRGITPFDLLGKSQNEAGNLAFMATRVRITPTGKQHPLARYESIIGVYGPRR